MHFKTTLKAIIAKGYILNGSLVFCEERKKHVLNRTKAGFWTAAILFQIKLGNFMFLITVLRIYWREKKGYCKLCFFPWK